MTPTPEMLERARRAALAEQDRIGPSFAADCSRFVRAIAEAVLADIPDPEAP